MTTTATPMDTSPAPVADYRANQWTLVYQGAITRNLTGGVNLHPVTYLLNGLRVAANVYTPPGFDAANTYPAVAVAHPNGGVKEQVAGLYAQRLAEAGLVTIAVDAAYQGASEGLPRQTDKPAHRVEDIFGMADFLSGFGGVDPTRIGLLGICGGGGYAVKAAQSDKRFAALATVSMFNSGRVRRNGLHDSMTDSIQDRLAQAAAARALEAIGGRVEYIGDVIPTAQQIAALPVGGLYREGIEYYGTTHAHPRSSSRYTASSLVDLMAFDSTDQIELINQPLLMIAGSEADTKYMTDDAFAKATGTVDKALHVIEGATHIGTYWVPEHVDDAVGQLVPFFSRTLAPK